MSHNGIQAIKPEIRILGIDDGGFVPRSRGRALVVGVVFRGGYWLDGVMHTYVAVDGFDATRRISNMVIRSPHYKQLRIIMLNGITFAGFNVVNIQTLNKTTNLPIIAITREKPDLTGIRKAIGNLPRCKARWNAILAAGDVFELTTRKPTESIFVHVAGMTIDETGRIVRLASTRSNVPEALRVAHLVASGISPS